MKYLLLLLGLLSTLWIQAQDTTYQNTATNILQSNSRLSLRGYAEGNYNQEFESGRRHNGNLEMRRMVLFTGYKFNKNTSFVSEIEIEHANQIFLEQAFVNHRFNRNINLRAGLLLIPMGIVNEYHEPTTFNGVERPFVDKYIIPTTWREMGVGLQGIFPNASLAYQVYVVNGFKSYDDDQGLISASNGFRKGRQKGIGSIMSSPNLSAKIDYFGAKNLKIGLATYMGQTQSSLYDELQESDDTLSRMADSSVLGMKMVGLDVRYNVDRWRLRGQAIYTMLNNTKEYSAFTGNSLSESMYGYYAEVAYNVLPIKAVQQLFPFVRYASFDTYHNGTSETPMDSKRTVITTGLSWFLHPGVVLKGDYQRIIKENSEQNLLNFGIGIWF